MREARVSAEQRFGRHSLVLHASGHGEGRQRDFDSLLALTLGAEENVAERRADANLLLLIYRAEWEKFRQAPPPMKAPLSFAIPLLPNLAEQKPKRKKTLPRLAWIGE